MTDTELQTAQDIARIENAIGALMALETTEMPSVISDLKAAKQTLRRSIKIRNRSEKTEDNSQAKLV